MALEPRSAFVKAVSALAKLAQPAVQAVKVREIGVLDRRRSRKIFGVKNRFHEKIGTCAAAAAFPAQASAF
jgi:hypothetical protein